MKHLNQINTEFIKIAQKLPNEDIKIGDKVKTDKGTGIVTNLLIPVFKQLSGSFPGG